MDVNFREGSWVVGRGMERLEPEGSLAAGMM